MAMTKKTTTTWTTPPVNEAFQAARTEFIQAALTAGKTDSAEANIEANDVGSRNWSNTTAANEWIAFLESQCAAANLVQTTTLTSI
jgi:hypothetical protein